MNLIKGNYILLLILACFAIYFVNLDAIYVNIMEARNFISAREMIQKNNWLLPTLNDEARYQKPPLPTWITAFSGLLFGIKNLVALRLPAAIMALFLVVISYKFLSRLTNNYKYAFISSLVLSTSFYIVLAGRDGQWDIFTHAFMMGCIYYLYQLFTTKKNKFRLAIIAALFFGMSFLSKGPVSAHTLLIPFIISYGIVFKFKNIKSRIKPLLLFIVVGLILSGWWHAYVYWKDPIELIKITQKEAWNWQGHNVKPFYYYWSFFIQSGAWAILALIGMAYPYLKDKVSNKKAYKLTIIWTVASLVLLTILPAKKSKYLLPTLIPLAFNTGFYLEYLILNFSTLKKKIETYPVLINFGLIAIIGVSFPIWGYLFMKDSFNGNWFWFILLAFIIAVISILIFKNLFKKNIQNAFYLIILFICITISFGMPLVKKISINPEFNNISKVALWEVNTHNKVYEFKDLTPELIWEYGKPMPILIKGDVITLPSEKSFGVLIRDERMEKFFEVFKDYSVKKITRYNINPREKNSSQYRTRLCRNLYLVSTSSLPNE